MKTFTTAAVAALALSLSAGTGAASGFNACKALQSSFNAYWKSKVVTNPLAAPPSYHVVDGGRIYICEWAGRRQAGGGFDYAVRFNFTASRSVAEAKQSFALMHANPKNVKAHLAGADEAYGYQEFANGETTSTLFSRRGRYTASLATGTPGAERGLLDAQAMLESFLRHLPKT